MEGWYGDSKATEKSQKQKSVQTDCEEKENKQTRESTDYEKWSSL